ncbi:MAG: hypothetical protein HC769_29625 [Cyanobacteria bacterium CRU_2_1]|nr:hypothetical protein [Cyanobacteria bacterium CRU_2_1]
MEDWQDDWIKTIESVADGVEQFLEDIGKGMGDAVDALIEFTEEMTEGVERAVSPGFDQIDNHISDWLEPFLFVLTGLEETIDQAVEPVTHTVEPLLNQHPVCVGCRHYHGQAYNGTMFVCAMHPYGVAQDVDHCPDKELTSWTLPQSWQNLMSNPDDADDF